MRESVFYFLSLAENKFYRVTFLSSIFYRVVFLKVGYIIHLFICYMKQNLLFNFQNFLLDLLDSIVQSLYSITFLQYL